MFAQCEDCGMWVPAELTHNGVAYVGHYVHCGWGHICSPDDLREMDHAEPRNRDTRNPAP